MQILKIVIKLKDLFKEFLHESSRRAPYEVVELYECKKTGHMKAVIKMSSRHTVIKNLSDIVIDNNLIIGFDSYTVRTLTYMATVETMKPDYAVVVQQLSDDVDEYILKIQSRKNNTSFFKSATDLINDKEVISKLSSDDAKRVGYLAGIRDTIKELQLKSKRL